SVEVLPVLDNEIEIKLDDSNLKIDVYRASGPGGQCVNTTDSAVRITHLPTGIVVTCQNEKSQLQNKEAAIKVMLGKLYELEKLNQQKEIDELRGQKMDNSFGSQIRNYVLFPYRLVKDLRSGYETGNVDAVLGGSLDKIIDEYHRWRLKNREN
ncbi:MAG: peptide chain release factor 2, partial [Eggerthellaceae bacterium]|nr:peptide chain release factor 2 [Eggerthellaceae bacterium]